MVVYRVLCIVRALVACAYCDATSLTAGDPELIALLENEYLSYDAVPEHFSELEAALAQKDDPREIFAAIYRLITEDAVEAIEDGYFDDTEWTAAFLLAFANLYRQAFLDYECGRLEAVPGAWIVAFDAAKSGNVTVFQHAVLGIHAHINRDIPYAIAAVTPAKDRARRFPDYLATNRFLVSTIQDAEALLATVYAGRLGELDAVLGGFDESLLRIVLTGWRLRAWRNAALFDGSQPEWVEGFAAGLLDRTTSRFARTIRSGTRKPAELSR
jgi:hypothetical protein